MPIHTVHSPASPSRGCGWWWVWWCGPFTDMRFVRVRSWVEHQRIRCSSSFGVFGPSGFIASAGPAPLVQLLVCPLVGVGCGGNVGLGVWGWVSGTLLGPEGPHMLVAPVLGVSGGWGFSWWSAPGPQTTGLLRTCSCGWGLWVWVWGVVLLVC